MFRIVQKMHRTLDLRATLGRRIAEPDKGMNFPRKNFTPPPTTRIRDLIEAAFIERMSEETNKCRSRPISLRGGSRGWKLPSEGSREEKRTENGIIS